MSGRVEGKVAFITGAARGQGRCDAVRLAQEGADIIAVDLCASLPTVEPLYPGATEQDLAETVRQVEALGRRIVARQADVRDFDALSTAFEEGFAELGRIDIVCANAGIFVFGDPSEKVSEEQWDEVNDINSKGTWHTCKAAIPRMLEQGEGGSLVLISSTAGLRGTPYVLAYTAAKHAVIGIMRTLALELGSRGIRVNSIHPTGVNTDMILNPALDRLFAPGGNPDPATTREILTSTNALPVPWVEPIDVANALLFLASEESRYVTGLELKVDAGFSIK
jgi:SDR family mycofactocin-dependent oxidoreductase